ncbi:polyprenyl synthetase family protein [Georgenia sp. Z1344]|uniref:polyprenyl synthetase family protein n=1 Tax=Georgenia sp. Z1344 TaxID=3416706 RepID=UPI003CE81801
MPGSAAVDGTTTPAPPSPAPSSDVSALAAQVDAFMSGAATLTEDLWDEVVAGPASSEALTELVAAARAADGGKYLRPRLVAASCYAAGGADLPLLRRVAGAQQLLHVALCVHDDLIDGDEVRHGRVGVVPRVESAAQAAGETATDARRRGSAAGVLAGDLAITTALGALVSAPAPADVRLRLAQTALSALQQAIAGETLDVWSETAPPETARPLSVAALKTASYSITLPLTLGAVAAGVTDEAALAALGEVGEPLGIAYQLRDDDLGLFGEPTTTGKSVVSDLRDGKRTEHVRVAALRATPEQRRDLDRLLGDPDLDDDGAEVLRTIIVSTGARAAVLEQVDALLGQALEAAEAGLPPALSTYLVGLTASLRDRER